MESAKPHQGKPGDGADSARYWFLAFVLIVAALAGLLLAAFLSVRHGKDDSDLWLKMARTYSGDPGRSNALLPMIEASDMLDHKGLRAIQSAWQNDHEDPITNPAFKQFTEQNLRVVSAAMRAASLSQCRFPASGSIRIDDPRPDIDSWVDVGFFLQQNARLVAAEGHPAEAAQRLMDLATMGERFRRPRGQATLTLHLIGMILTEQAFDQLQALEENANFPPEACDRLVAQLDALAEIPSPAIEGLQAEAFMMSDEISRRGSSPERMRSLILFVTSETDAARAMDTVNALQKDIETFPEEWARVWSKISKLQKLDWAERPSLDRNWLQAETTNKLVLLLMPDVETVLQREKVLVARRLLLRWAFEQGGSSKPQAPPDDPFDGKPMRSSGNILYSVGPDGVDNGGKTTFDPKHGRRSAGDIIIHVRNSE